MTNSVNASKAGAIDTFSDHSLLYVIRKFKWPKGELKIVKVRSFKMCVEDEFLIDLRTINWSCILNYSYLDSICEAFNSNVKNVAEKHAQREEFS